jgi:4-hydroxybenzoate polyprenyltransferase
VADPTLPATSDSDRRRAKGVPAELWRRPWRGFLAYQRFVRLPAFGLTAMLPLLGAGAISTQPETASLTPRQTWGLLLIALAYHQFGYVLNDVVDLPIDRQQPRRAGYPLVQGRIQPWQALLFALMQIPLAFALLIWLGASWTAVGLLALAFLAGAVYDVWGKRTRTPLLLDFVQGLAWVCLVLCGAAIAASQPLAAQSPTAPIWVLTSLVFLFIVLVNGVHASLRDLESDWAAGVHTTALAFGARPTTTGHFVPGRLVAYALALQACLTVLFLLPLWAGWFPYSAGLRLLVATVLALLLAAGGWLTGRTLFPRPGVPITLPVMAYVILTLFCLLVLFAPLMEPALSLTILAVYVAPLLVHDTLFKWLAGRRGVNPSGRTRPPESSTPSSHA